MTMEGRNGLARYETKSQGRRGLCLIINNKNFLNANAIRKGCEHDEEKLKKLFEDLNFTVTVKNDLEWDEMKKVARQFAEEDHNEFDAFVFIIMSHGGEMDLIQGIAGGTISIGNLMLEFTSTRCPTLKDKPKLFIIQSCRGDREEAGIRGIDSNMSLDSTLSKGVCPKEADFLLAFSTPPGYLAIRYDSGSPFIQVLVKVIRELHENHHLLDILTEVSRLVVEEEGGMQISASTHTLRKQLWL